jgi:hypothetical protein
MAKTITRETKREGQRKAKRWIAHKNWNKERANLLMVGSYLTHNPSNVTCMQIMRSSNNGGL